MRKSILVVILVFVAVGAKAQDYLCDVKEAMRVEWPANRTVNLVFHGHSVPSGYFVTPEVRTAEAYPYLTLKNVKALYPYAVINTITTSIGGENAVNGAERFGRDVLPHRPDVVFIDYALNDRSVGIEKAEKAWRKMIEEAMEYGAKVVLLTPTPDTTENILDDNAPLALYSSMIRRLAKEYGVGLADVYAGFKKIASDGGDIGEYMSQFNHPNAKGHEVVANEIIKLF